MPLLTIGNLFQTKSDTLREEDNLYWLYARNTMLPILLTINIFAIVALSLFMFEDWFTSPESFAVLFQAKLIAIAVLVASYVIAATERGRKYLEIGIVISVLTLVASISFQAALIEEQFMVPLLAILITFSSASLFPWKLRYHIIVTVISILGVILNMIAMQAPPYFPPPRETMAGVVFPLATILLAIFSGRHRFALWNTQRTLKESESRFRQVAEHSADIVWIWSPNRRLQYVSPAYTKFTGRDPAPMYKSPRRALEFIRKDDRANFGKALEAIMRGTTQKIDLHLSHADGTEYTLEAWGAPIKDDNGNVIRCIGVWRDITKRTRLISKLDTMATTDELTGAHNRRFFFDVAAKEAKRSVRHQIPLSLILFDIDFFKKINDAYGHQSGDQVLVAMSHACQETLRAEDVFARIGGEEFVLLLPETNSNEAAIIAERVRQLVSDLIIANNGKTISTTVSIGVTSWISGKGLDIHTLLKEADDAMYRSKSDGRNKVTVAGV